MQYAECLKKRYNAVDGTFYDDINVHIKSNELVATSHQAIFTKKTGIIILSGHGSKVINKKNSIAGSQIILYMDEECIKVKGNGTERVEAEFQGNQLMVS